ncbi:hypothetical protein BGX20_004516 [Mortierella sp. AD010]|nr:hypothetical protein BGX20_004516 [Mortierella sp. AD010]
MPQYRSEMMTCVQQLKANFRSNCQDPYSTHGSTFCQCCAIVGDLIRPDASANAVNNMFDNAISRIPSMPWPVYISVSNEGSSDFMLGLAVTCSPFQYMGFDTCGKWNKGQRPSKTEDFGNWPKGSAQEQHYKVRDELFNSRDGESRGFPIVAGNPFNMTSG